jgi:hypothetical protein
MSILRVDGVWPRLGCRQMIALDTVAKQIRQWSPRPVSFLLNRVRLRPVLLPGTGGPFTPSGMPEFAAAAINPAAGAFQRRANDPSPSCCAAAQYRGARGGVDRVHETPEDDRLSPAAAIFCMVLFSSIGWALILTLVFWLV